MFNLIIATDYEYGIGKENGIPWKCVKDLKNFKKVTDKNIVIVGRKTWETMPQDKILKTRIVIVVSKTMKDSKIHNLHIKPDSTEALKYGKCIKRNNEIYVIGGKRIYDESIENEELNEVYYTRIYGRYECDVYVEKMGKIMKEWTIKEKKKYNECEIFIYVKNKK